MKIKTDLRIDILQTLYSNIEKLVESLVSESLPSIWRTRPEMIFESDNLNFILLDKNTSNRFLRLFGSLFSTIAHVMKDIYLDQPYGSLIMMEYIIEFFGMNPNDYKNIYSLYYECRQRIDKEHVSH